MDHQAALPRRCTRRQWLQQLAAATLLAGAKPSGFAADASGTSAVNLLVLGDSLSAEYGLPRGTGWVKLLADRLATVSAKPTTKRPTQYNVVNASISGETTSGGLRRLPALLTEHRPAIVLLQLGANDGLRGLSIDAMRANLVAMIDAASSHGARTMLIGIRVPPNYGRDYTEKFYAVYAELARSKKVALAPFLLDGFADRIDYFQPDRIHPTVAAQPIMLENVWPHLQPLLESSSA